MVEGDTVNVCVLLVCYFSEVVAESQNLDEKKQQIHQEISRKGKPGHTHGLFW